MGAKWLRKVASKNQWFGKVERYHHCNCLAQAIVKEGLKNVAAGANPMDLKKGIDKAVEANRLLIWPKTKKIGDSAEKKNKTSLPHFLLK